MNEKEDKLAKGRLGLKEMTDKATDWYNWTVRKEIAVHPHNDYVPREFMQKIEEWMYPYVHRMFMTDYLGIEDMQAFSLHINELIFKLRVKAVEATWLWHWNEMGFTGRIKWRWENKRLTQYGLRDFERLCREARYVPFL